MSDAGALSIASNTVWKRLRSLALGNNNMSDAGGIAVGKSIAWNLQMLELCDNRIGWKTAISKECNICWENTRIVELSSLKSLTVERKNAFRALEPKKFYSFGDD